MCWVCAQLSLFSCLTFFLSSKQQCVFCKMIFLTGFYYTVSCSNETIVRYLQADNTPKIWQAMTNDQRHKKNLSPKGFIAWVPYFATPWGVCGRRGIEIGVCSGASLYLGNLFYCFIKRVKVTVLQGCVCLCVFYFVAFLWQFKELFYYHRTVKVMGYVMETLGHRIDSNICDYWYLIAVECAHKL